MEFRFQCMPVLEAEQRRRPKSGQQGGTKARKMWWPGERRKEEFQGEASGQLCRESMKTG